MRRIELERGRLHEALRASNGFIQRAARKLGVGRLTVYRRTRELGLLPAADEMRRATGWVYGAPRD